MSQTTHNTRMTKKALLRGVSLFILTGALAAGPAYASEEAADTGESIEALAVTSSAAANIAQPAAPIREESRYFLQLITQMYDGREDLSHSQVVGLARLREGDRSYSQFDFGDGAVVITGENNLSVGQFANTSPAELELEYDYSTKKVIGNTGQAAFHNKYVRPWLGKAPDLDSNAQWQSSLPISAFGLNGANGGDVKIELSREYFEHNGKPMVLVHYSIPAFAYDLNGKMIVQWGRGISLTDRSFGQIYINAALHRSAVRENGSVGNPYRYARTMVAANNDGSAMVDYRTVKQLAPYIDKFFSKEAIEVIPTGKVAAVADKRPLVLAQNMDLMALSIGEDGANPAPIVAGAQTSGNRGNESQKTNSALTKTVNDVGTSGGSTEGLGARALTMDGEIFADNGFAGTDEDQSLVTNEQVHQAQDGRRGGGPNDPEELGARAVERLVNDRTYNPQTQNDEYWRLRGQGVSDEEIRRIQSQGGSGTGSGNAPPPGAGGPPSVGGPPGIGGPPPGTTPPPPSSGVDPNSAAAFGFTDPLPGGGSGGSSDSDGSSTSSSTPLPPLPSGPGNPNNTFGGQGTGASGAGQGAGSFPESSTSNLSNNATSTLSVSTLTVTPVDFENAELELQDFKNPEFKNPEFKNPEFKNPDFKAPDASQFPETDPGDKDGYPGTGQYPAFDFKDLSLTFNTDLEPYEDWLQTQDLRRLDRLSMQAGFPNFAAAAGAAEYLIRLTRDPKFRQYALSNPACSPSLGCVGTLGEFARRRSLLALGDLLADSRDVFSTGGFSDLGISGFNLAFGLRDFGIQDGDLIDVEVTQFGRTIFTLENHLLLTDGSAFSTNLNSGVATLVVTALNEGTASPNTAEVTVDNVVNGSGDQDFSLMTNQTAILRIEANATPNGTE